MVTSIFINNVDVTQYGVLPIKTSRKLDEALDGGRIDLVSTPFATPFEPQSIVTINYDDTDSERFVVAVDKVDQSIMDREIYDHQISIIEETKILEGKLVDNLTFTNVLSRRSETSQSLVKPTVIPRSNIADRITPSSLIVSPIPKNVKVYIPSVDEYITDIGAGLYYRTIESKLNIYELVNNEWTLRQSINNSRHGYMLSSNAERVKIEYKDIWKGGIAHFDVIFYINLVEQTEIPATPRYTITGVVNRLLNTYECKNVLETNKYSFDIDQANQYASVISPEFSITRCTLFEALRQVGGFIHAMPRLKNGVISFEPFGSDVTAKINDYRVKKSSTWNIEEYCDCIDSQVDNVMNTDPDGSGATVEPSFGGFNTVRAEGRVLITDTDIFIPTNEDIMKVNALVIYYSLSNGTTGSVDITDYVYEKSLYDLLSSCKTVATESKAFSLYYTQGQQGIHGLTFTVNDTAIPEIFKKPAIRNIIQLEANLTDGDANNINLFDLGFEISYTPKCSVRVRQHKSNINSTKNSRTLVFEQQASFIDNKYYGENMKGTVERLGNEDIEETYIFPNVSYIPPIGSMINDYTISEILTERNATDIHCTFVLSKKFNRWSQYVGIKNNIRQYEISERLTTNRNVIYEDFCCISKTKQVAPTGANLPLITPSGLNEYKDHIASGLGSNALTQARMGIDEDEEGNYLSRVALPITNYYMGNAVIFSFKFVDNYSAGEQSFDFKNDSLDWSNNKRVGQAFRYGNEYGKFSTLKLNMVFSGGFYAGGTTPLSLGNKLPQIDTLETYDLSGQEILPTFKTQNNIWVDKDNRERICMNIQQNFVTDIDSVVIGTALAKNFYTGVDISLFGGLSGYLVNNKVGSLQQKIDLTNAKMVYWFGTPSALTMVSTYEEFVDEYITNYSPDKISVGEGVEIVPDGETNPIATYVFIDDTAPITIKSYVLQQELSVDTTTMSITIPGITTTETGESLVFVDRKTKELYFADNSVKGGSISGYSLNFRHFKRI